jgi:hypothetical protein
MAITNLPDLMDKVFSSTRAIDRAWAMIGFSTGQTSVEEERLMYTALMIEAGLCMRDCGLDVSIMECHPRFADNDNPERIAEMHFCFLRFNDQDFGLHGVRGLPNLIEDCRLHQFRVRGWSLARNEEPNDMTQLRQLEARHHGFKEMLLPPFQIAISSQVAMDLQAQTHQVTSTSTRPRL